LDKEETIKCIIENKINETTFQVPDLLRRVTQDINRTMKFEGKIINYKLSAELLPMYPDLFQQACLQTSLKTGAKKC